MKEKIIRMIHIVSACIPLLLMGLLIAHRILTGGGITRRNYWPTRRKARSWRHW